MTSLSTDGFATGWLEYEKVLGQRPILKGSPQDIVDQFNGLGVALAAQAPPPDTSVETRDDTADGVPVRIYKSLDSGDQKLPIGVYYHGGGLLCGNIDGEDAWCRFIAKATPCIIVSVDYRLSQTDKFPAQLDDSMKAYHWVLKNASTLNALPNKIFTIGASAGGGLALGVADQLIKSGSRSKICGVVGLVPVTAHPSNVPEKYKSIYNSYEENKTDVPIIDADSMATFFQASAVDFKDEKAFVVLSKDLKEFPPVYIATCGKDPLRDDGVVLEAMLNDLGVPTKRDHYEGEPHYFWLFPGIQGGVEFLENVAKGAQWVLGAGS
ncbi:Alpha/Beta hydrolase protein [Amylocarpus encephaloides]|uniref:Alpha/Beta hydrolase protein n=1 Tax=Amylocarpus encephaloides TaxID=45428 RepID=A0A9P8C562_9HELO|nr:Alpha/Beta hydrolase protein [Amylocarpus encephaloides]